MGNSKSTVGGSNIRDVSLKMVRWIQGLLSCLVIPLEVLFYKDNGGLVVVRKKHESTEDTSKRKE